MKTSRRMDGHTFSVTHWIYAKDGAPLHFDAFGRDPTLPPPEEFGPEHARHEFDVTALREVLHDDRGRLVVGEEGTLCFGPWCELSFVGRGKIGHGHDLLLTDVGIWASRLLQERHPGTGEELRLPPSGRAPSPQVWRGMLVAIPAQVRMLWCGKDLELTRGEYAIVDALSSAPGEVLTHKELYETYRGKGVCAGFGGDDFSTNMRNMMKRIRRKFAAVDPKFGAIESRSGVGYCWRAGE